MALCGKDFTLMATFYAPRTLEALHGFWPPEVRYFHGAQSSRSNLDARVAAQVSRWGGVGLSRETVRESSIIFIQL
jgi:hypothetical protein